MQVINSSTGFAETLRIERSLGRSIGLVPTMGALHDGHKSLIERAAAECDVVAVTIFVNPLQFNEAADLEAYPRNFEADALIASTAGAAVLFVPTVKEMYPNYPTQVQTVVQVSGVSEVLEGASRPGHFEGVATVVTKLFNLAGYCTAYFGEKDFQQLAVVRKIVRDLSMQLRIVGCPTVREPDGLALSSRNARLSDDERRAAPVIRAALDAGIAAISGGERDSKRVRSEMEDVIAGEPLAILDYATVVDPTTFLVPDRIESEVRLLIAARFGAVRLIDNDGVSVDGIQELLSTYVQGASEDATGSRHTTTGFTQSNAGFTQSNTGTRVIPAEQIVMARNGRREN